MDIVYLAGIVVFAAFSSALNQVYRICLYRSTLPGVVVGGGFAPADLAIEVVPRSVEFQSGGPGVMVTR